jgi:hypothetical protein
VHVETALTQIALGQLDPARSALALAEGAYQANPMATIDHAQWLMARARLALAQQESTAAQQFAGDALARLRGDFGDAHWEVAEARALLALADWQRKPGPNERAALAEALEWHQRERPWHPDTLRLREAVGNGGWQ